MSRGMGVNQRLWDWHFQVQQLVSLVPSHLLIVAKQRGDTHPNLFFLKMVNFLVYIFHMFFLFASLNKIWSYKICKSSHSACICILHSVQKSL